MHPDSKDIRQRLPNAAEEVGKLLHAEAKKIRDAEDPRAAADGFVADKYWQIVFRDLAGTPEKLAQLFAQTNAFRDLYSSEGEDTSTAEDQSEI